MPAPVPPPPSFAEFEEQLQRKPPPETKIETDTSFDFDVDGIPLSQEERQQMLEEQHRLYENIMKEKAANDIAIARASADAFDSRSPAAASRAEVRNEQMDSMGRDVDPRAAGGPKTEGEQTDINEPKRYVQIGGNQTVALHGQERTKKAIKEGTALLVQCINCQNWMQVSEDVLVFLKSHTHINLTIREKITGDGHCHSNVLPCLPSSMSRSETNGSFDKRAGNSIDNG
jgi:hypothetical protein